VAQAGNLIRREETTLVIIDIQERLAAVMDRREEVVSRTARLARAAAVVEIPIVVTRQYPKGLGGTVPELEEALTDLAESGAKVVGLDKTAFCCAAEDDFNETLSAMGRKQVVLAGMETHICVTQTALALEPDYEVHVVADAVCSRSPLDNDVALDRLRAAGVIVTTSESVMYEAVGRAGTPEFKRLLEIVKE
jgi:nicotinamidase-related amidase